MKSFAYLNAKNLEGAKVALMHDHDPASELANFKLLEGFQANPMPYLRQAHLFCLPSVFEGMPNALVEAMVARTPVVAAD